MALRLTTATVPSFSLSSPSHSKFSLLYTFRSISAVHWRSKTAGLLSPRTTRTTPVCAQVEESERKLVEKDDRETGWGKVSAVLFDMDGVLCNSEEPSRRAGVDVFAEMGVDVTVDDFVPFMGTGEANFLGGVAQAKGVKGFDTDVAKKRFFEIYLEKYAKPNSGIGFPGALELITQCKDKGLKVAVASSADRIKVDANLAAAGLPVELFDAIVSADAFENLKPAPDIFISASKILNVPQSECVVIEDALAGLQAANAAKMRCIVVTTTLSEETLATEAPSLIRKDIGNITLDDVISGGSSRYNEKLQASRFVNSLPQTGATFEGEANKTFSFLGLQASRRNIVKYGSLGVSLSCLFFAVSNRKAMQYASPKALWNSIFGVGSPSFDPNAVMTEINLFPPDLLICNSRSGRVQQFVNYISDLEKRGNALTVPEFPSRLDWLNSAPLQFRRDLKGKVVVLDFWTYCCINCMHVLPDLEFLEKKYNGMAFTVVGVHSAKFDNEKDSEAIRNAVLRYGITHPVVNDGDMYLWRELGVNSWPTFAVIGPTGRVIAQISGEGRRKDLDDIVEAALLFYGKRKMLDDTPLPLGLERDNDPRLLTSPLKFPGKLAVDTLNNRLFISDSNHNRIVVTDLDGNYITQVGSSGEDGLRDGNFDDATFNRPQGLAYNTKRNVLYVADTENHALREIDFVSDVVRTLAGNGTKGSDYRGGRKGMAQLLNSPWDVCFDPVNEKVYIAMAGQHQIWVHDVVNETTLAFSGDGSERNLNGSSATSTSYAQPSGMSFSSDMKEIYIADSESSSIRALDIKTGGSRLLAGGDPIFSDNLFKYGDHDGIGSEVLLQHPLGVCFAQDGQVYIADSYNHKIKKLDPSSKRVTSVVGNGKAGFMDGKALAAQLSEPSGLVQAGNGIFYIADTNNSVIRYMDLNHGEPDIRTLDLKGVQPPAPKARTMKRLRKRIASDTQIITVDGSQSAEGNLYLRISLPPGYHFSKEARSKFTVDTEPENAIMFEPLDGSLNPEGSATLHFRRETPSTSMGRINCKVYYCKEDEVCLYQSLAFEVPFKEGILESAPADFTLQYVVKPRDTRDSTQLPSSP